MRMTGTVLQSAAIMPDPLTPKPAGRHLRVLYAEDMRELRDLMGIIMEKDHHELATCENGRLAFERLKSDPAAFDLLITDHHMPLMNGLELVYQARVLNFPGKILVFSSELSPAIKAAYLELKVDRVLPKPIWPAALRQLLVEVFPAEPAAAGAG
jgi:two-component system chemotaxis response regulator CheY